MTSTTLRKILVATAAIAALSVAACGKKADTNNTATDNAMAPAADNAMAPAADNTMAPANNTAK
jgi:predicted outer membrane protein